MESSDASQDSHDEDEEDNGNSDGGNRFLGFMFGNVDDAGDLDADYLDDDAKEHLAALANKLGRALTDIDLSIRARSPASASEQDYDEKAEDAINYEDIDEEYEGPEVLATSEEDHLLPKKEYYSAAASISGYAAPVFDEENYDEDEGGDEPRPRGDEFNAESRGTVVSAVEHVKSPPVENEKTAEEFAPLPNVDDVDSTIDGLCQYEEPSKLIRYSSSSLPVLYVEDGVVILRFSEIFGVHEPFKKPETKRQPRYPPHKDWFKMSGFVDNVEEDEEEFLTSSNQLCSLSKIPIASSEEYDLLGNVDRELAHQSSGMALLDNGDDDQSSSLPAKPMKEETLANPYSHDSFSESPEFYMLDHYEWEDKIIWDDSPSRSDEQKDIALSQAESDTSGSIKNGNGSKHQTEMFENKACSEMDHNFMLKSFGVSSDPLKHMESLKMNPAALNSHHPTLITFEGRFASGNILSEVGARNSVEEVNKRVGPWLSNKSIAKNMELLKDSWLDDIVWETGTVVPKPKLILDLQDPQMLFEVLENKDFPHLRAHAGAMMIANSSKQLASENIEPQSQGHHPLGRFNISNDKFYSNKKTSQQSKATSKKRMVPGVKVMHSVPALKLQTMKTKLSNKDIANFHRPRSFWFPHHNEVAAKEQGELSAQGPMKVILKSMGGKGSKLHVDATQTVLSLMGKASKKLDFKYSEKVKIFYSSKELKGHKTLAQQNVRPNSILHLVRTKIHLWQKAQKLPGENKPTRPPGAFKKKSELSAKSGHIFLMEYCEERPLLLGNVGMGARLCTYYQKFNPGDQTALTLRNGNPNLGSLLTLETSDKSPFLGDINPGCYQSSLETNMYRAPIFSHKVSSTDYLLVRSAKGKLSLRRIDRMYVAGQQEPHMEVFSPQSKNMHTFLGNRLLVYIYREFRASEKPGFLPCVRADELSVRFPNIPESFIRKKLKHCADLQRGTTGELLWVMRRSFRIPSEEELRRMVTPENVCAYESMLAGQHRLKRLGISRLTNTAVLPYAMSQLPDEAITLAAASLIERELQITPWNLSNNFVTCMMQDRDSIERLEITGTGDPSGRGLGFSYVRVTPKAPISSTVVKKKAAAARGGSAVTGTDADLRRLNMDAAREVLLKFNVPEEQIDKMTRWHRIAMVRKLSSEQAAFGIKVEATPLNKFARGQRMSFLQLQQQTREKCKEVWDRQVHSLSAADIEELESDSEANSDLDSFVGDLENLLDAEEGEDSEIGKDGSGRDKSEGVRGLGMRRRPSQALAEEEIEDEAAEAAELCRMLMDDDEVEGRKKIKNWPVGKDDVENGMPGLLASNGSANANLGSVDRFKRVNRTALPDIAIYNRTREMGELLLKSNLPIKQSKFNSKLDFQFGELRKKSKVVDASKVMKEKKPTDKPVRESFVCGACGQAGHMRTNKNCPKYGEEPDKLDNVEYGKPSSEPSTPQPPKMIIKKLLAKVGSKGFLESENVSTSQVKAPPKILPVKFKCSSMDNKPPEKNVSEISQPAINAETSDAGAIKVNKIKFSSRAKTDDIEPRRAIQVQSHVDADLSHRPKKIIIKQPTGIKQIEAQTSGSEPTGQKREKTVMISTLDRHMKLARELPLEDAWRKPPSDSRRLWDKEGWRTVEDRQKEFEETRRQIEEKQLNLESDLNKYRSREEVVEGRTSKAKKKKKKKVMISDELEDRSIGVDRRIPERDRAAKKRPIHDSGFGHLASDHGQKKKRRRSGEVVLANILEGVVDKLRDRTDISYLFLKPVSKKEAPDYHDIVDTPMDLSTIRGKVRNMDYSSVDDFRNDVSQIAYNAHLYNDCRNPGIPPLADQLLQLCDHLLDQHRDELLDAERCIHRNT